MREFRVETKEVPRRAQFLARPYLPSSKIWNLAAQAELPLGRAA